MKYDVNDAILMQNIIMVILPSCMCELDFVKVLCNNFPWPVSLVWKSNAKQLGLDKNYNLQRMQLRKFVQPAILSITNPSKYRVFKPLQEPTPLQDRLRQFCANQSRLSFYSAGNPEPQISHDQASNRTKSGYEITRLEWFNFGLPVFRILYEIN